MLELGSLVFASPWILLALTALPVIWWILRITPPLLRVQPFPPLSFMLKLEKQEETPAQTPLWLLLLRLLIAALVILGLSRPLWNPGERMFGTGPLILVVDNGWAAAPNWQKTQQTGRSLINQAEREGRTASILATAPDAIKGKVQPTGLLRPEDARQTLRTLQPLPWKTDRRAALGAIAGLSVTGSAHVAYLSDGHGDNDVTDLMQRLQEFGSLQLFRHGGPATAHLVKAPVSEIDGLSTIVLRAGSAGAEKLRVRLDDDEGRLLGRADAVFEDGDSSAKVSFQIPSDIRNRAARIAIEGETGAGAAFLMDERWRRRPVGIVSARGGSEAQPLLSSNYYIARALEPFSDVRRGTPDQLLDAEQAMIVLADAVKLTGAERERILGWIEKGGVLLRFAGPGMKRDGDALSPVRLRNTGRELGGAMSWSEPARLMPFEEGSPFHGLQIPPDVRIKKQILAEPTLDLNDRTWVRLSDGTPLVTAERRGEGWVVLIHVTANTDWSNLPLSGLFIQMLERVAGLSRGVAGKEGDIVYPPLRTMNGFGALGAPPAEAAAIRGADFVEARPSHLSPPGYYGKGSARRALNVSSGTDGIAAISDIPNGVEARGYDVQPGTEIKPWLLLAAVLLLILDLTVSYLLRGIRPGSVRLKRGDAAAAILLGILLALPAGDASAQINPRPGEPETVTSQPKNKEDAFALRATLQTHLAYVVTGDSTIDSISRAGLEGLSTVLQRRTSVEPGPPLAIDIERDELALIPVLYWPVSQRQRPPSDRAIAKLNAYLRTGGTILFDTREQGSINTSIMGSGGAATAKLRNLIGELDIPPLIPVPNDHVLTKAFYLLNHFPGRWTGGTVWVERRGGRHNDGVSSVIIGSHDWAAAWAREKNGLPMFPVVPNGERQREYAFRFGVNWIMYAMTGNYKTDQVHVPSIIERLGQ